METEHRYNLAEAYTATDFGHMLIFNEILFGQEHPYVRKHLDAHFHHTDLSRFHICLTGLKKSVSTGYYHLSAPAFMELFIRCEHEVRACLAGHGCSCDMQVVVYDQSKRIAILFTPGPEADLSPLQVAGKIGDIFRAAYEARGCTLDGVYANFTALSPLLRGYEEIPSAFLRVRELCELSFFRMEPMVMTEEALSALRIPLRREQLFEALEELGRAMDHGDADAARALCTRLFLKRLKPSFSHAMLDEALHELRRQVYRYSEIYHLDFPAPPEEILHPDRPNIELLCADAAELLAACAAAVSRRGSPMSYISLEAMRYLNTHFRQDISLEEVAAHINVNPSYLSRVFSREVGQSLRSYLISLRIDRAKALLADPRLRVADVGARVGIKSAKYFTLTFKRETGMTPQQYRSGLS